MSEFEGFIQAGGASRRMGRDKALLQIGGQTLVERAADALSEIAPERIFVVGNFAPDSFDFPVLHDVSNKRGRGSIIGLQTALHHAEDWAAVLACDLPFVTGAVFKRLANLKTPDFDAVVPIQADGKPQPLCALYKRENCLTEIEICLSEADWKLQNFLRRIRTRFVEWNNFADLPNAENLFFNVNTPEDFAAVEKF